MLKKQTYFSCLLLFYEIQKYLLNDMKHIVNMCYITYFCFNYTLRQSLVFYTILCSVICTV